jgi:hypothetical protein
MIPVFQRNPFPIESKPLKNSGFLLKLFYGVFFEKHSGNFSKSVIILNTSSTGALTTH